jgi:hypothetical protein
METARAQFFVMALTGLPLMLGLVHLAFHIFLPGRDDR